MKTKTGFIMATLLTLASSSSIMAAPAAAPLMSTPLMSTPFSPAANVSTPLLPARQAFILKVKSSPGAIEARWTTPPGYHVYRSSLALSAPDGLRIGAPSITSRTVSGYTTVEARFPYCGTGRATPVPIVVKAQGCHVNAPSVCYMPQRRHVRVTLAHHVC